MADSTFDIVSKVDPMEVDNARFDGALKRFAEEVASRDFFEVHRTFTPHDGRRMNDVRYALTLICTILGGYFHRDSEHERFLEMYNDEFPMRDEIEDRLNYALATIEAADFNPRSRIWRKPDLFSAIVELDALRVREGETVHPRVLQARVEPFLDAVTDLESQSRSTGLFDDITSSSEVIAYLDAARQGVNDRGNRIRRGEILRSVMGRGW